MVEDTLNLSSDKIAARARVIKVRGILRPLVKEAGKYGEQIKGTLDNASILQMTEGDEPFELKDDKFTFYLKYNKKAGAIQPQSGTFLAKRFIPDAEKLVAKRTSTKPTPGTISQLYDTEVTLLYTELPVTIKQEGSDEKVETVMGGYTFIDETMTEVDVKEHIKTQLVIGKKSATVVRSLAMDAIAKTHPEFKETLKTQGAEALAQMLGVKYDSEQDKFVEN